ncbi:MAG TPA: glycoside hydrolase family 5 protein, partial [Clostridia bacterium]|nr:glycoside hydrolase family 5 protein [Clostridia bacterium]
MKFITASSLAGLILLTASLSGKGDIRFAGVNLAGAEFGESNLPGTHGTHYRYPDQQEVNYFKARGLNTVRLPFRWERLQRSLNAPLDPTELGGAGRFHPFVSQTTAQGVYVILDPHNYARYSGNLIGSAAVPNAAFSNFWWRVADIYKTNNQVIFGLMNEPHTMTTEAWRDAAQSAINGIRAAGATNLILVPGNGWTGAHSWLQNWYGTPNAQVMLSLTDPLNNFAFEVHQYLDTDSSGTSSTIVSPTIGAERLAAFTQWCRNNNRKGFLGEFAVANSTIGAGIGDEAITNMLIHVRANADVWLGWTWWAAGPWWGEYQFTLEPTSNFTVDRPVMGPLRNSLPLPVTRLHLAGPTQFQFATWPGFLYQP